MNPIPENISIETFISSIDGGKNLFLDILDNLNVSKIPYSVIGSIARKCWIAHREPTKDVDFLVLDEHKSQVRKILNSVRHDKVISPDPSQISFVRNDCELTIDFMIATSGFDPEESCVHDTVPLDIFNGRSKMRVARPEYLVWLMSRSPHEKHHIDICNFIKSGCLDIKKMFKWMLYAGDDEAIRTILNINRIRYNKY